MRILVVEDRVVPMSSFSEARTLSSMTDGPMATRLGRGGPARQAGFTLVELMTVLTVIGILMAVGVPSYQYVTNSTRVSNEVNSLLGDMMYARSEAINQGINVSVCPSADGANCTVSGTSWQNGWIVFTDVNANGTVDATPPNNDMVLRVQKAFGGTDTFTSDNATLYYVTFNREGFATGLNANGVNFVIRTTSASVTWIRCLNTTIGALTTQRGGQGTCPTS